MSSELYFSGASWVSVPKEQYVGKNKENGTGILTAYFRNSFILPDKCKLEFAISASSRYRLWINGIHAVAGPCKGDRWRHYYEKLDLSQYLREGMNILSVKVVAHPREELQTPDEIGPVWSIPKAAGPCLIVKGDCIDENGKIAATVTTGQSDWFALLDDAISWRFFPLSEWMGSMEHVNGEKLPFGWMNSDMKYDDQWAPVKVKWPVVYDIFARIPLFPLRERPIPLLYEREMKFVSEMPVSDKTISSFSFITGQMNGAQWGEASIPPHSQRVIELDAGELTTGYVKIPVKGGRGSKLTLRYAECYSLENPGKIYTIKGIRDDSEHFSLIGHEDVYFPSGRQEMYEPFWWRTFRFIRIEVETGSEALEIAPPIYVETGYPLDVKSSIETQEEWVGKLWDISVRTLRRCMHETYEDCPYYEQLQYTMDSRLEILFTYMVSGDTRMALRTIEDFHSSLLPEGVIQARFPSDIPLVIPGFALYWILMLEDYYWQTGDLSIPKRYRPTVDSILDWYDRKIGSYGLAENLGYWEFVDWVDEWSGTEGMPAAIRKGPSSIHNLVYAYALKAASRMSQLTNRHDTAAEYEWRASAILDAIEKHCWDEKEGLYTEGPGFDAYSQHAQVWAVLNGLATGDRAKSIMKKALIKENISKCSFSMQFYVFRALETAGMYEYTLKLWDNWKALLPLNVTTIPESTTMPRSECHAWGAVPLYEFTRCILGVNPLEAGWGKILIKPQCLSFSSASGKVATPKGLVYVKWEKRGETGDQLRIVANGPENTQIFVQSPDGTIAEYPRENDL